MVRLYVSLCKRWGPDKLTLSAYAWKRQSKWVKVIDLFFKKPHHCARQYLRETAQPGND